MSRHLWCALITVMLSLPFAMVVAGAIGVRSPSSTIKKAFPWPNGKRVAVSLSFDDARPSQVDRGLDVLNPTGVKVTFFVVPENVKKRLEGWKHAVASGHEIGNHSLTHPCSGNFPFSLPQRPGKLHLGANGPKCRWGECRDSALLGVRMVTFAYPCGQKFVGRGRQLKSYVPLIAEKFLVGRGF